MQHTVVCVPPGTMLPVTPYDPPGVHEPPDAVIVACADMADPQLPPGRFVEQGAALVSTAGEPEQLDPL
jgi:hypothetical protein